MKCKNCDNEARTSIRNGKPTLYCSDKCRKNFNYGRTCVECGCKRGYSDKNVTGKCKSCLDADLHQRALSYVLDSMRDWYKRYGEVPSSLDWNIAQARRQAAPLRWEIIKKRHRDRTWPSPTNAQRLFGSWSKAIEAAGFESMQPGERRNPEAWRRNITRAHRDRAA